METQRQYTARYTLIFSSFMIFTAVFIGALTSVDKNTMRMLANGYLAIGTILALQVIWRYPVFGIFLLSLTTSFSYSFVVGVLPDRLIEIRTDDLLFVATLIAVITTWSRGKIEISYKIMSLHGVFFVLIWFGLFSTLYNVLFRQVPIERFVRSLFFWFKYTQYYLIFLLAALLINSNKNRRLILGALVFGLIVVNGWGLYQLVTGDYGYWGGHLRIAMPFDTGPNVLGAYYIVTLPPLFALIFDKKINLKGRILITVLLLLSTIMLLFTGSRAGIIGFIVSALIVALFRIRDSVSFQQASRFLGGVIILLFPVIMYFGKNYIAIKRLLIFDRTSILDTRLNGIWIPLVKKTIAINPILGTGIMLFDKYRVRAENYYVRLFAEQGFVGIFLFVVVIIFLFITTVRVNRDAKDPILRNVATGFLGSIVGLLFASLWSDKFVVVRIMTPFWILAGLIVGSYQANYEKV